jgi:hypothetical protein
MRQTIQATLPQIREELTRGAQGVGKSYAYRPGCPLKEHGALHTDLFLKCNYYQKQQTHVPFSLLLTLQP